jgi:hypothetical protein
VIELPQKIGPPHSKKATQFDSINKPNAGLAKSPSTRTRTCQRSAYICHPRARRNRHL